jgi:hypothetical protein
MLYWSISWGVSLAVVILWVVGELYHERFQGGGGVHGPIFVRVFAKTILCIVLSVAIHAVIDPEHDRGILEVHTSQIDRAAYGFAVTGALLVAFPTLRIGAGILLMAGLVSLAECCQWLGLLPGIFRPIDWVSGLFGVLAAGGPMWLGAYRARRNMALENKDVSAAETPSKAGRRRERI